MPNGNDTAFNVLYFLLDWVLYLTYSTQFQAVHFTEWNNALNIALIWKVPTCLVDIPEVWREFENH